MPRADKDMVMMFEEAYKQQPGNEELGAQTFFANVRASNWKSAQQVYWFISLLQHCSRALFKRLGEVSVASALRSSLSVQDALLRMFTGCNTDV
jgi:hypothetical protein